MKFNRKVFLCGFVVALFFISYFNVSFSQESSHSERVERRYKESSAFQRMYWRFLRYIEYHPNQRIFRAAQQNSIEGVKSALRAGADPEAIFSSIRDPLNHLVQIYSEHAALLLDAGVNFRLLDPTVRWALLHEAVKWERTDQVKALLDARTFLDDEPRSETGNDRYGSLLHKSSHSNGKIAQLLIDTGIEVSKVNRYGETALHLAATNNNVEAAKTFLAAGASVDQTDRSGMTPLYRALVSDNADVVGLLLKNGADTTKKGGKCWTQITPFQFAARSNSNWNAFLREFLSRGVIEPVVGVSEERVRAKRYLYNQHRLAAEEFLDEVSSTVLSRDAKNIIMTDMLGHQRMTDTEIDQLHRDEIDRGGLLYEVGLE